MSGQPIFRKRLLWFLLALLPAGSIIWHSLQSQSRPSLDKAVRLFQKAEKLYFLEDPNEYTDSQALHMYLEAASILQQGNDSLRITIDCYTKAGNIKQTYSLHQEARAFYYRSLALNQKPVADSILLYEAYLYLGSSYYLNNIIDSAKHYFEASSALADDLDNRTVPDQQRLYNSLGAIYYQSGNYLQAKNYFELALSFIKRGTADYDDDYASVVSNIATCEQEIKNYNEAIRLYRELLKRGARKEVIQQSLAIAFFKAQHSDSALQILQSVNAPPSIHKIKSYNLLGKIYEQARKWNTAEVYYDSAISLNKEMFGTQKNRERGISYQNKASLAQQRGLHNEALFWCNRALEELHFNFKANHLHDLPADSQNSVSPIITFEVLKLKSELFLEKFRGQGKEQDLFEAVNTFKAAFAESNFIKRTFDNDQARIFFTSNYKELYGQAIAAAFDAAQRKPAYTDALIYLLENYKGTILAHNISLQELKAKSGISEEELDREKNLKDLISIYASRINSTEAAKDEAALRKRYVELQVELSRLQKRFEENISFNFYRYQQASPDFSMQALQNQLDNNTAVINFFADSQFVYSIAVSSTQYQLNKVAIDSSLNGHLTQLYHALRDQTEGKRYGGINSSHALYSLLLLPSQQVWKHKEKLVILPDGPLNTLPFDALSLQPEVPDYLVKERTISYHYSYTLLTAAKHKANIDFNNTLGYAPFAIADSSILHTRMPVLVQSATELQPLKGNLAIGASATKQAFMKGVPQRSIIHLATHAYMDADSLKGRGWIEMYPNTVKPDSSRLFLDEIYNLNLSRTNLVVLSACETASGMNQQGEGLLSLSRAFLYAGAGSVISTLWKTEDKATAFVMSRFYHHLNSGANKEEALRLSKIDLLENQQISPVYKSPNYWSNFIFVGQVEQQDQSLLVWLKYRWPFVFLFALLLIPAVMLWRRRLNMVNRMAVSA